MPAAASDRMISCSWRVSCALSAAVGSSMTISCGVARERAQDLDLLLLGRPQPRRPDRRRQVEAGDAARAS